MSKVESLADTADRLSRNRARLAIVLSLVLVLQQIAFFVDADRFGARNPAWMMLVTALVISMIKGGWHRPRAARALMNDEVTRANSASARTFGFVTAIMTGVALFGVESVAPGALSTRQVIHVIVTAGLVAALVRFGLLERRALG